LPHLVPARSLKICACMIQCLLHQPEELGALIAHLHVPNEIAASRRATHLRDPLGDNLILVPGQHCTEPSGPLLDRKRTHVTSVLPKISYCSYACPPVKAGFIPFFDWNLCGCRNPADSQP